MTSRFIFRDRSFHIDAGPVPLGRAIRDQHPGASWNDVKRLIASGKVTVNGETLTDPGSPLVNNASVCIRMTTRAKAAGVSEADLVHLDSQLVVVNKPSGISTVPFDASELDTLESRVQRELKNRSSSKLLPVLHTVHRIDKETSGLVVFARTRPALQHLKHQFRLHSVERRYRALAHGNVRSTTHQTRLVPNRGDGLRGSTDNPTLGRLAITHVESLRQLAGATVIACRLETGRTHQIRVHLSESGHPLVGEKVYIRGYQGTLIEAPRLMLHAETLGFRHPTSEELLHFSAPIPRDMSTRIDTLRQDAR